MGLTIPRPCGRGYPLRPLRGRVTNAPSPQPSPACAAEARYGGRRPVEREGDVDTTGDVPSPAQRRGCSLMPVADCLVPVSSRF